MDKRQVSPLFPDIKSGLDKINPFSLCGMLRAMVVNPYLVAWTRFFLTRRSCWLLFQGSPKVFTPVSVRTPQGSTASPLVFVIYVSGLHREIPDGLTLPYANDCTLMVSSDSYRRNVQLRQGHYAILNVKGSRFGVSFSIPETELIHWHMNRDRDPPSQAPIHADRSVLNLVVELRWLRLWFRPSLSTTPHFTKRLGKAQAAFVAVKRLPPPGMGLPPFLCHCLATSLLFPILSYHVDVFSPTVHMVKKQALYWHMVQRWSKNCFKCTPTDSLPIDASLPPLDLLLNYKRHLADLRVLCSRPRDQPRYGPSGPISENPLSPLPCPRPQAPPGEERGQLPPPPVASAQTLFKEHSSLTVGRPSPLDAVPSKSQQARPPSCDLPAPAR